MKRKWEHDYLVDRIERLRSEGRTLASIAKRIGLEYDEDEDCIVLPGYVACDPDGGPEIAFPYADSPREAAQCYCDDGDWGVEDASVAVQLSVGVRVAFVDDDGNVDTDVPEWDSKLAIVDPEEPICVAAKDGCHQWSRAQALVGGCDQNPGVHGLGGCSIQTTSVCVLCGMAYQSTSNSQGSNTLYDHDTDRYIKEHVDVDALIRYHDGDFPDNLDPDSELACELNDRRSGDE